MSNHPSDIPPSQHILSTLAKIHGPWAFLYWQVQASDLRNIQGDQFIIWGKGLEQCRGRMIALLGNRKKNIHNVWMKKFSGGHWKLTREFFVVAREFLDLWWVINHLKRWKEFTDLSKRRCNLNEIPNFLNLYQERADAFLFVKFLNKGSLFPIYLPKICMTL